MNELKRSYLKHCVHKTCAVKLCETGVKEQNNFFSGNLG